MTRRRKKDSAEKKFLSNNDVFADVFNNLVFCGTGLVVDPDDLEDSAARSTYKSLADEQNFLHEQERDVAKFWKKGGAILSLLGGENQTKIDKTMALRVFGYEGADYRYQIKARSEEAREASKNGDKRLARTIRARKFYPVITVILYYGIDRRWSKYKSLHECLELPPGFEKIVEDRHINVIELAWLSDETEKSLKSDLRFLVNALKQMRITGKYIPSSIEELKHIEDVLDVLQAWGGHDEFFDEAVIKYEEGGEQLVIDFVGGMKRAAREEGWVEGMAEGQAKGRAEESRLASKAFAAGAEMLKKLGASPENIAKFLALYPNLKIE